MSLSKIPGLVLHLPMNEQNGVVANDNSRYGNDGSLGGGDADKMPVWAEHGLRFDGTDDYVDCGNDSSLDIIDAITVAVWVKPKILSFGGITGKTEYDDCMALTLRNAADNMIAFGFKTTTGSTYHHYSNYIADDWIYIVGTYDKDAGANNYKIYKNANVIGQETTTGNILINNNDLHIGKNGGGGRFNGSIGDVRIYNRALSAAEITDLYNERRHIYV